MIADLREELLAEIEYLRREIQTLKMERYDSSSGSDSTGDGVIEFSLYKKGVKISGDTKKYKEILKSRGATWNSTLRSWIMTIPKAQILIPKMIKKFGDKIVITSSELKPDEDDYTI